jgi:hypothetical protein
MRYSVTLERGGWVVWDTISREIITHPATSEEAHEAVKEWNARCVTRQVDPPIKVDGWVPAGELTLWLLAEDGWWGSVQGKEGVRWIRAEDLREARGSNGR